MILTSTRSHGSFTLIAKGYVDHVDDMFCFFPELTLRQIVEFLVGCTADEAGEWLRVLTILRPLFMRRVIQEYSAKVACENKRVSVYLKRNIAIAVMPNGITRSTPKCDSITWSTPTWYYAGIPVSSLQSK